MTRRTAPETTPLELEDATPYNAFLMKAEYQPPNEQHPDWPDQIRFTWRVVDPNGGGDQELWTWASIKLGQTRGGKASKLRTILNALAGRKRTDPIAWLEDGSDGKPITWGYASGDDVKVDPESGDPHLRIVGHNEDAGDGSSKFVVDQYAVAAKSTRRADPAPREEVSAAVAAAGVPF